MWFFNIDRKKLKMNIFLGLETALDTVDHDLLMSKAAAYGITRGPYKWISSYLPRREQHCRMSTVRSHQRIVQCGIPQDSCLGPLLFIIYVSDFPLCLSRSFPNIYADDNTVTYPPEDIEILCDDLDEELTHISEWM